MPHKEKCLFMSGGKGIQKHLLERLGGLSHLATLHRRAAGQFQKAQGPLHTGLSPIYGFTVVIPHENTLPWKISAGKEIQNWWDGWMCEVTHGSQCEYHE